MTRVSRRPHQPLFRVLDDVGHVEVLHGVADLPVIPFELDVEKVLPDRDALLLSLLCLEFSYLLHTREKRRSTFYKAALLDAIQGQFI